MPECYTCGQIGSHSAACPERDTKPSGNAGSPEPFKGLLPKIEKERFAVEWAMRYPGTEGRDWAAAKAAAQVMWDAAWQAARALPVQPEGWVPDTDDVTTLKHIKTYLNTVTVHRNKIGPLATKAQQWSHALGDILARLSASPTPSPAPARQYSVDRYVDGILMSEGADGIIAQTTEEAIEKAKALFASDAQPGEMARTTFKVAGIQRAPAQPGDAAMRAAEKIARRIERSLIATYIGDDCLSDIASILQPYLSPVPGLTKDEHDFLLVMCSMVRRAIGDDPADRLLAITRRLTSPSDQSR